MVDAAAAAAAAAKIRHVGSIKKRKVQKYNAMRRAAVSMCSAFFPTQKSSRTIPRSSFLRSRKIVRKVTSLKFLKILT